MIPYKIITPTETIDMNLPTWPEVTIKQLIGIAGIDPETKPIELVSAVTGLDVKFLAALATDQFGKIHLKVVQVLGDDDAGIEWNALPYPKKIELDGRVIKVPQDAGTFAYGANLAVQALLRENKENEMVVMPEAFALIMYEHITGDTYNEEKAMEMVPSIEKQPAKIIYPVARFFLQILRAYQTFGLNSLNGKQK